MFEFLHTHIPNPVALALGPVQLYWYSLFMVSAILAGIFFSKRLARRYNISEDQVYDMCFYLVIAGIIGARLYATALFWRYYFIEHPLEIIQVWQGGLAIHGAIAGGVIALIWQSKKKKLSFWLMSDIFAPFLALGQALGRWGNYFNQEVFGRPTELAWGIPIAATHRPAGYGEFEFFHPTFLYESLLNLAIFGILIALHRYRLKYPNLKMLQPGAIALTYLALYSAVRIGMEQFRIDETPIIYGLRLPVIVSTLVIIAVFTFFVLRYNANKTYDHA